MTDLTHADPCVIFALAREAGPFLREFRPQQRFAGAPCRARFCGPAWLSVLVLESGVGPTRARAALDWLLDQPKLEDVAYKPRLVISAGFAGALQPDCRVGDVILATEVIDPAGGCWPATWPGDLPPGEWRPPLHRGRLLSVDRLIGDPAAKRRLGEQHAAAAVDMESAAVARMCSERGVPFGCVRAISDTADTPLSPQLLGVLAGGRVAPLRLAGVLARSPRLAGEVWRLARQTRYAAGQLGLALGELLTLTLSWADEL